MAPARGRSCRPPHHDHSTVVRAVGLIHLHAQDRDRVEAPAASTPRQGGAPLERLARRLLFQHFTPAGFAGLEA